MGQGDLSLANGFCPFFLCLCPGVLCFSAGIFGQSALGFSFLPFAFGRGLGHFSFNRSSGGDQFVCDGRFLGHEGDGGLGLGFNSIFLGHSPLEESKNGRAHG